MTAEEFRTWLRHHVTTFTGVGSWLASFPTTEGAQPTQAQVRATWFRVLEQTALDDAKDATDALFRGDEQFPHPGFDCHPATVRRLARGFARFRTPPEQAPSYGREETFRCLQCRDQGLVLVLHPEVVRAARDDAARWLAVGSTYSAVVCCTCQRAERWSSKWRDGKGNAPIRTYNAETQPLYPSNFSKAESKAGLLAWIDAHPAADKYAFEAQEWS